MRLSFNLEFFGQCSEVINFYSSVFENSTVKFKTFNEMPMKEVFGITEKGLDMVWKSKLSINCGNTELCFEMADSMLIAMGNSLSFSKLQYNPVICVAHNDGNYAHTLFENLYGNKHSFEELQEGKVADKYGIKWRYEKNDNCGIFYCLSFDGFCSDVISHYENVFNTKATDVITYSNSPYADKICAAGANKIYSAILRFQNGNKAFALKLYDEPESAINGSYGYDPNALLFYHQHYNPVFTVRDNDKTYLTDSFSRLSNGAKLNKPLASTDDGGMHGSLIDKYGICWEFYLDKNDNDD